METAQIRDQGAKRWWELMQQDQYGISLGNINWDQLPTSAREKLSTYFNDSLVPKIVGKTIPDMWGGDMSYDTAIGLGLTGGPSGRGIDGPFQFTDQGIGGLETMGRYLRNSEYLPKLQGYTARDALPQTAQLYAIDPQLAESLGITYERALADANAFGEQYNTSQEASDSADAREGWLMALGTIGAGVGGAYMNGTLNGATQAAGAAPGAAAPVVEGGMSSIPGQTLAEQFGIPQASFAGPAGSTPIMSSQGVTGYMLSNGAIVPATGFGGQAVSLGLAGGMAAPMLASSAVNNALPSSPTPSPTPTPGINPLTAAAPSILDGLLSKGAGALAAAGLGGLLGGSNGAKQTGTTTTTQEPWSVQQPYLKNAWDAATNQFNSTNPLTTQANANYQSLLGGSTTNPMLGMDNPYLQSAIDSAQGDVVRQATGAFNNANRSSGSYGNSGLQEAFARELPRQLGNISTNMRMQDYTGQQQLNENAVNRTTAATSNANSYAWQPVQNYANVVGAQNWGGSQNTPYYTNQNANILGGAMTGASIYNSLFGNK